MVLCRVVMTVLAVVVSCGDVFMVGGTLMIMVSGDSGVAIIYLYSYDVVVFFFIVMVLAIVLV